MRSVAPSCKVTAMDRLTRELYEGEPKIEWADSDSGVPTGDLLSAIVGTTYVDVQASEPNAEDLGRYVAFLAACPGGSTVTIDGYRDDTEAVVLVTSRFEGLLASLDGCDLQTQVALIRPRYEPAYCRLELAHFHPGGVGFGVRYFGTLVRRLAGAGFASVDFLAAGHAGSAYNGYLTWAALGAELILTSEMREAAERAGFYGIRTTHQLFLHPEGRRWWIDNGSTTEATFNLAQDSLHNALLNEYMKRKGVELS